jgi:hypothetical protein
MTKFKSFPTHFLIAFLPGKSKCQRDRSPQMHLPFAFALLGLVSRNAQPAPQGKLQPGHFALIRFVIVAQQVQEAMQDKPADLIQG